MKLKSLVKSAQIKFTHAGDEFSFIVNPPSELSRLAIIDAILTGSIESIHHALFPIVIGWAGITSDDGVPVPFENMDKAGNPDGTTKLGDLLSMLPVEMHLEIMVGLLTFVGLEHFAKRINNTKGSLTGKVGSLDPTVTNPSDTPLTQ